MSNKKKVLVLSDWFSPAFRAGGPVRSLDAMVSLLKDDVEFHILCRNKDWMEQEPLGVPSDQWLDQGHYFVNYLSEPHVGKVLKAVKSFQGDAVYFNGLYSPAFNALPLMWLLRSGKSRLILAPRGMLNPNAIALKAGRKKALLSVLKLLGMSRKIDVHSASPKETMHVRDMLPRLSFERIFQVDNVPAVPSASAHSSVPENIAFLSVGRISPVKNSHFLIQQYKRSQPPNARLQLVGSTDEQAYQDRCLELAKGEKTIEFLGAIDPRQLQPLYAESSFFCLATTGENFGHAIIEALAAGTPAIISDQTPWNDLQESGAGWVVPLNQPEQWQRAFTEAASLSTDEYQRMSEAAKSYVRNKFNIDEIRQQYLSMFA